MSDDINCLRGKYVLVRVEVTCGNLFFFSHGCIPTNDISVPTSTCPTTSPPLPPFLRVFPCIASTHPSSAHACRLSVTGLPHKWRPPAADLPARGLQGPVGRAGRYVPPYRSVSFFPPSSPPTPSLTHTPFTHTLRVSRAHDRSDLPLVLHSYSPP